MHQCRYCEFLYEEPVSPCKKCGKWNSMIKVIPGTTPGVNLAVSINSGTVEEEERVSTGLTEFDRVLGVSESGTGLVIQSVVLLSGDPGIGKSTILLQTCANVAQDADVLYVTGEESVSAVRSRAIRVSSKQDRLYILAESDFGKIEAEIKRLKPRIVVIDSVQTMLVPDTNGAAGSVTQLRAIGPLVTELAKRYKCGILLVGHVTKDGELAGPQTLAHAVDATIEFSGEKGESTRILRSTKNRHGSTLEIGVLEMHGGGIRDVENPSAHFLRQRHKGEPGNVVTAVCGKEGTRAMLVEIQVLLGPEAPRRQIIAMGIEAVRIQKVVAILDRKCGIEVGDHELFVNVTGGVEAQEPAMDLAIAIAIASEIWQKSTADDVLVFGEMGLNGEIRDTRQSQVRIAEAVSMGFHRAITPPLDELVVDEIEMVRCRTIKDALNAVFDREK